MPSKPSIIPATVSSSPTLASNYAQACDRLLSRGTADPAELRAALQEIATQAVRAGDIIRRLRTLVRFDNSQRASTDVNSLVSEVVGLLQSDAHSHGARLCCEL